MINPSLFTSASPARRFGVDSHPFKPKFGKAKADGAPPKLSSLARSVRAASAKRAGAVTTGSAARGSAKLARGRGVSGSRSAGVSSRPQRAIVKARVVVNARAGTSSKKAANPKAALARHLDYLERDEVGEDGERGQFFGPEGSLDRRDVVATLAEKVAEDRHYFRLIVSPEKASDLNLEEFTRDFMAQTEKDLGTRLEWAGVAHYNTDNPHVHLIIRGVDERGADLVINREYVSHGFRQTAQDIATRHLGPRLESDLEQERISQISAERFTPIDRQLIDRSRQSEDGLVSTRPVAAEPEWALKKRIAEIGRLQHLEGKGLAEEMEPGRWALDDQLEPKLRQIGQRMDIVKQIHERMGQGARGLDIVVYNKEAPPAPELVGEVVDRGMVNEIDDRQFALVSAEDGKSYYVALSKFSERTGQPARIGTIVNLHPAKRPVLTRADENAIAFAEKNDGIYDAQKHRDEAIRSGAIRGSLDPDHYMEMHIKRMEGNVRRGLVEQIDSGQYRIPADLKAQLEAVAAKGRDSGTFVELQPQSALSLKDQMSATGPTWLDSKIARNDHSKPHREIGTSPFQKRVAAALRGRVAVLRSRGLIEEVDGQSRLKPQALDMMYEQELTARAAALSAKHGTYVSLDTAKVFRGTLERIEQFDSGQHAIVVDKSTQQYTVVPVPSEHFGRQLGKSIEVSGRGVRVPQRTLPAQMQIRVRYLALDAPTRQITLTRGR